GSDFSQRINLAFPAGQAHWFLGHTYFDMGEYEKSQDHYNEAFSLHQHA
ncbi:unnamed protein product, partial [marine sediment metagenome]